MTEQHVAFDQHGQVGIITLCRPQALNAISLAMIQLIHNQLLIWQIDPNIQAVMIESRMPKVFCAGGDIRWLYEAGKKNDAAVQEFFWHEYRLNYYIHNYPKPYIALLDGLVFGGGVGISLHGSLPIASSRCTVAMPETGIGFFPDIGASYLLSKCAGAFGQYLGLTGASLNATDAYGCGLVKYLIDSEHFSALKSLLFATDLSTNPQHIVETCIKQFAEAAVSSLNSLLPIHLAALNEIFALGSVEDIFNILCITHEPFLDDIYTKLLKKSPISLKITFKQIQQACKLSLVDCLAMDYCLAENFLHGQDFYAGVKALLIDKNQNPQWQFKSIVDVPESLMAQYFTGSWNKLNLC